MDALSILKQSSSLNNSQVLCEDPMSKLIEKITAEEVESLNDVKIYHLNRNNVLKSLYNYDEIIKIKKLKNFSDFVHLTMLIEENKDLINFSYKMILITSINEEKENYNYLKKIIASIIIIRLIHNYRGLNIYNEKDEDLLKKIEDENKKYINYNINKFKGLINSKINIEDLYCEIIYKLLKKGNFGYIIKIFDCLDLTSINFTKKMYERLLQLFDKRFVKYYQIINTNDLKNRDKILFYYVLLKYILKNPFYISHIPFLDKTQKFFRKLIKSQYNEVFSNLDESLNAKIIYIFKVLLDSDYYFRNLAFYLDTIQNTNQQVIVDNNNNNNNELINLENELEKIKYEIGSTHVISIKNNSSLNKNNLTEKNNNKQILEEIEEENNTEKANFESNEMRQKFELENGSFVSHIISEDKYNDKTNDGIIKCHKIINDKQYILGEGNYFTEILSETEEPTNEIIKKDNKFNIIFGDYQIEVSTYNSFINGNDNKLIFFDKKKKKIVKEIEGYSFPLSTNGMALLHNEILLCPNKKYNSEQKQGIISIYFNFIQNQYLTFFHEIKDFNVNCICNLLNPEKKAINFVLIGGYSKDSSIRLYKINYIYNAPIITIEVQFIRDIFIVENIFFAITKKPINYIKQSKKTGKIKIWSNKSIYLCSSLNLSKYLYFEELERLESFYEDYNDSEKFDRYLY